MKLISSCLKLTPTPTMFRARVRTPEEVDGAEEAPNCRNNHGKESIVKFAFEENMKDGSISKLLITKTGHRPTQYKKIVDTLPVIYVDTDSGGLYEVIWTGNDLVEIDFMQTYLNVN